MNTLIIVPDATHAGRALHIENMLYDLGEITASYKLSFLLENPAVLKKLKNSAAHATKVEFTRLSQTHRRLVSSKFAYKIEFSDRVTR